MKKVLFVLFALSLLVPVACGKGGDMVSDVKNVFEKAAADIENLSKELDNIKGIEDMKKLQENAGKVMSDMGTAMAELQKKHGSAEPTAEQMQAVAPAQEKLRAAGEAFEKKANEVAAKFAALSGDTNAAAEGEDK